MPKDYYHILGVSKSASQDDVKTAFRKLAHQHHPDKTGGDDKKFKELNEAYQVLGDPQKRQKYDQFGSSAFENGGNGAGGFQGFDFGGAGFEDFGDIFGEMFGGGRSRGRKARGSDIQVDAELTFKEAVFGVDKEITLTKPNTCQHCGGVGAEPGKGMRTCEDCNGKGVKMAQQRTILGMIQTRVTCSSCHGTGEVPKEKCKTCDGAGVTRSRKTITVSIPAGIDDGMTLRVRGEGEASARGATAGDLLLRIHVHADKKFEREGDTIFSTVRIGFSQAALGDVVEVQTVDGPIELKIPAGTQSGTALRLRGKGVPSRHGRGDQIVRVEVVTPQKLTREQKRLLEELDLR
ncbi:MAG: molecular chaperone DnaJ [Patescibacteria group bacterium]